MDACELLPLHAACLNDNQGHLFVEPFAGALLFVNGPTHIYLYIYIYIYIAVRHTYIPYMYDEDDDI